MRTTRPETTETEGAPLDRRSVMECAAWIGTGLLWTVVGGVPRTLGLIGTAEADSVQGGFTFLQMSDNHIGFKAGPYQDVPGTLQAAIGTARALPHRPSMMLHTGDISHFAKEEQFDTADAINATLGVDIHHVPGEHDMLDPGRKLYLARYGKKTKGDGWYSFDDHGVHFIGLSNVTHNGPDGQWLLGADQIAWLADDLRAVRNSTPIVVFAHVPLWTIYAKWGWGTGDASAALPLFRRFGSVTFLNGHIHQIVQKVEGAIVYHTARSTAFPQPAPGTAAHGGPVMTIPAGDVGGYLGITTATLYRTTTRLAVTDITLG
ncbi:metallophosphoesterase family protein [Acidisoma silvae]|uniref:Metallophosphoesterase n=1 Tax=Acidisoma silvae TaxID=2802396 RepID=A0A963YNP9_9PROT|nr:metallophosphoesterase [Acidisoma silvae]MCB8874195.1 metallophosphoesterase [Acidisoma silvae]